MNYWANGVQKRVTRRRVLAASGATALGAAFLAACGGGSDKGVGGDSSGLLSKPVDTTKQAVPGGAWPSTFDREQAHIDPNTNNASAALISWVTPLYSLLLKYGFGMNADAAGPESITGDAAESWELSPDGTQITLKLRQNHTFDPRPPTSGRAMTAADVKFNWDRFVAGGSFAGDIVQSKNPIGPIESLSTPDDRTIVVKLAFPYGLITEVLAFQSYFFIAPREFESGFNSRTEARGSGPWLLEKWEPSVSFDLRRNPNWYIKGRPFLDSWSRKIVPEYATGLAQFEAGSLGTIRSELRTSYA